MDISCSQIFGLVFLVNTNIFLIVSVSTPNWADYKSSDDVQHRTGLWKNCAGIDFDCYWSFFMQKDRYGAKPKAWFEATKGLMAVALVLGLEALVLALISLNCKTICCVNINKVLCVLLSVLCADITSGIAVFGAKAKEDLGIMEKYGWSYWMAVGANVGAAVTALTYGCIGWSGD